MKRRNVLLSLIAACTAPLASKQTGSAAATAPVPPAGRIPLRELRYCNGDDTYGYLTIAEHEAAEAAEAAAAANPGAPIAEACDDLYTADAEFIPSGNWLVCNVTTPQASEFTDPYAVPTDFGDWPSCLANVMQDRGRWMTKDEAIAAVLRHNRSVIGRGGDQWAVAAEVGEPQGIPSVCYEFGREAIGMVTRSEFRPARVYRR